MDQAPKVKYEVYDDTQEGLHEANEDEYLKDIFCFYVFHIGQILMG